jgi:hypothetical protein
MDLPHLMDNALRCPQALGQAALTHNSTASATAKEFIAGRNEREEPSGLQGDSGLLNNNRLVMPSTGMTRGESDKRPQRPRGAGFVEGAAGT